MKKLYTLLLTAVSAASFAQAPIITGIMDGDCSGGNPKVVELYAAGVVNFALFSLQNQTNGNTTWGETLNLATFGTRTNSFVYIVQGDPALVGSVFTTEFPSIPAANVIYTGVGSGIPQPTNINGDDRIRLINDATTVVIDQYGVTDTDGTGAAWEYTDSWAKRNNSTGPNGSAFNTANWTFGGVASLDGLGICQGATSGFGTIVPFGSYTLSVAQNDIAGLSVYPNPVTNGNLFITSNSGSSKTVIIYDVLGKLVLKGNVINQPLNVSSLNGGVYIVKITEDGKTATRKLVIR